MGRVDAILIAGPTASGKSALAARLARERGGTVVNADSMQCYRDLRILTARPSPAEEAAVPHRLFGHRDGAVNGSVGLWLQEAASVLAELRQAGSLPVVAGGTGLYLKALTEGLSALPAVPDAVRAAVRAEADGRPTPELHARLAARDSETASRLRPTDRLRVLRALEIEAATGRSLVALQVTRTAGPLAGMRVASVFLAPDRTVLRERIDRRFEAMIREGALDEVAALQERNLDPALPVMRAHGVPALLAHLAGTVSLPDAIGRGQADTRAYAKRQVTWFRHQMPDFVALDPAIGLDALAAAVTARADAG